MPIFQPSAQSRQLCRFAKNIKDWEVRNDPCFDLICFPAVYCEIWGKLAKAQERRPLCDAIHAWRVQTAEFQVTGYGLAFYISWHHSYWILYCTVPFGLQVINFLLHLRVVSWDRYPLQCHLLQRNILSTEHWPEASKMASISWPDTTSVSRSCSGDVSDPKWYAQWHHQVFGW